MTATSDIADLLEHLTPEERAELDDLLGPAPIWSALPGPQMDAYYSEADITGYGGAAGGGKSDLIAGLALTKHKRVLVMRKEKAQTEGIVQRLTEIIGNRDGYNSQKSIWNIPDRALVEFGGLDNPGDEQRWQGRPHDLKAFDEVTEQREHQVRFCMGWNRTNNPNLRPRVLMTFNPPTTSDGQWVIKFFGPWLQKNHPNPAKPGELRWFTTIKGEDVEVPDSRPFILVDDEPCYDFDPATVREEDKIKPLSRTFIPARVTDNPYYMESGYMATLQSMPEPLRSQMLYGDFTAGLEDDPWQVIPSAWIQAAMDRWTDKAPKGPMDSMGVDVARGGRDKTVIARRHGVWFDKLQRHPGANTPDGPAAAGLVITARRDRAPVHIDIIGWGSSAYDTLKSNKVQVIGINAARKSVGRSLDGGLPFANLRAEMVWRMREALDPAKDSAIALPDDAQLKADLCAYKWKPTTQGIQIESKEEMIKRLGRSPDDGDAVCMANITTVKTEVIEAMTRQDDKPYDPRERLRRR